MDIRNHKHIIVSGDTGNALGIVRAIAEGGISPILIYLVEDTHLPCLIKSRYITTVHRVFSYEEALDLLIDLYGNEPQTPFVYTCDDSIESLVDNRYNDLSGKFYFFNAGEAGRINKFMNKHEICLVAEKCGCRIPKQEIVDTGVLPTTLKYPVITKTLMSIMGLWKGDVYICHNEEQLKEAYKKIQSPELLLQEYIYKQNELAIQGFSIDGGREVYLPYGISYLRFSNESYGCYMYCKPLQDEILIQRVKNIIKECHYTGCFEVEFLIDKEGNLWFMEVNFRYSFWNYAVTYGGVNFPLTWAKSVLDNHIIVPDEKDIKQYFTAMSEPGDFGQSVATKKMAIFKWLKEVHNTDMLYFYNPNDPLPAWSFWTHKILRKIVRIITRNKNINK